MMVLKFLTYSLALPMVALSIAAQPITVNRSNSHYYVFEGKPTVLITSAEHYGAVVNKDFNYIAYFDALKAHGLNYTRIYPGFLFEPMGKFVEGNTLGVKPSSLILPWARSSKPGYPLGGNLFDLDRWDVKFFERLRDFIAKAGERGIVVEICFYNAQYGDTWPMSPLYYENNVQDEGHSDYKEAQTLKHPDLVRREDEYVRKIVEEVNEFENVILEICDEPLVTGTPIELAGPWVAHNIAMINQAERRLPKKHLVAQQMEGPIGGDCDFTADPGISVIVTQYVWLASHEQMGGMMALDYKYDKNKPIDFNETDYYPLYQGDRVAASRVEAWEFIVGGGSSFNQLNGLFTVANPAGNTPENSQLLRSLENLKKFIYSFDFLKMAPDRNVIRHGIPEGVFGRAISEPGKQYAFYHHHSVWGRGTSSYKVTPGNYKEDFVLALPAGSYRVEWVDPASGSVVQSQKLEHTGGDCRLPSPAHSVDIALRVKAEAS